MIAGKIPLWWLCFDEDREVDYAMFLGQYTRGAFGTDDCLDLGPLDTVESEEYFGAALWYFNKALTHPLKSIIKMLLLEMLLAAPKHDLLCHRFRNFILSQTRNSNLIDPSMFTMEAILKHNGNRDPEIFDFIKKCFYLRYEIKLLQKLTMKEILSRDIFERYPIPRDAAYDLDDFGVWPLPEQILFGQQVFSLLTNVYTRISLLHEGATGSIAPQDMAMIGRKLAVCLENKPGKIPVFHKPIKNLNVTSLIFAINSRKSWSVCTDGSSIVGSSDIIYCLAYLIWNDVFDPALVKMVPNPTPVTIHEVINLAGRIGEIFGISDVTEIDFDNFSEPEKVTKMLIVVSFEGHSQNKDVNDFSVIYKNHWGELFLHRFRTPMAFKEFIHQNDKIFHRVEMHYYIQRNSQYYEKIIERTKKIVTHIFSMEDLKPLL
ncbi:MAG: class I adenylate cyclase [Syntrophales bacterium]|nr:class I adenylate cyclase [Syntrophales bacterium]